MAFGIQLRYEYEICDKCRKPATAQDPVVELYQSEGRGAKGDRNIIYVHFSHLEKAKKASEKAEEATR